MVLNAPVPVQWFRQAVENEMELLSIFDQFPIYSVKFTSFSMISLENVDVHPINKLSTTPVLHWLGYDSVAD